MKKFTVKLLTTALFMGLASTGVVSALPRPLWDQPTLDYKGYQLVGTKNGEVIVKTRGSGRVVRTFQLQKGLVVRDLFFLNSHQVIAASQSNQTVFWDLATKRIVRRFPERVYGISHNEESLLSYDDDTKTISIYSYPGFAQTCEIPLDSPNVGIADFAFSPNDKFLAILLAPGRPESEENYPLPSPAKTHTRYSKLYNIQICQEVQNFSKKFQIYDIGNFTGDSKFYDIDRYYESNGTTEKRYIKEPLRLDLTTNELIKL
jgi:WD40 repeat protein